MRRRTRELQLIQRHQQQRLQIGILDAPIGQFTAARRATDPGGETRRKRYPAPRRPRRPTSLRTRCGSTALRLRPAKHLEQCARRVQLNLRSRAEPHAARHGQPRRKSAAVIFFADARCSSSSRTAPVPQATRMPSCEASSTCPGSPCSPEATRARARCARLHHANVVLATGKGLNARTCRSIDSARLAPVDDASAF